MKRFYDIELEQKSTDEQILRANDAIRVFENSDAWLVISRRLYASKKRYESILTRHAERVSLAEYAEASGAVKAIGDFELAVKKIREEAAKLTNE